METNFVIVSIDIGGTGFRITDQKNTFLVEGNYHRDQTVIGETNNLLPVLLTFFDNQITTSGSLQVYGSIFYNYVIEDAELSEKIRNGLHDRVTTFFIGSNDFTDITKPALGGNQHNLRAFFSRVERSDKDFMKGTVNIIKDLLNGFNNSFTEKYPNT